MLSIHEKPWVLLLVGAIWGCSPQPAERAEDVTTQSFPLQVDDALGRASWHSTRPSFDALAYRTAVRLADGRVLVAGGFDTRTDNPSRKAEVFDPVTETWNEIRSMNREHIGARGFLLNDGRVLLLGSEFLAVDIPEIFDPSTETWTDCPSLESDIWLWGTTETLLPDGRLLVTGGLFAPEAYFFDSNDLTWSVAPPMKYPRINHTATLLADGRVLLAGGIGVAMDMIADEERLISEAFDPSTNQWTEVAALNGPHSDHLAHLLADGSVILLDGESTESEIFDPTPEPLGQWYYGPPFSYDTGTYRKDFAVVTLQDQRLLLVGGYVEENIEAQSLYLSPSSQEWTPAGKLHISRDRLSATLLEDGRVLIAGGSSIYSHFSPPPLQAAEVFVPNASVWSALPDEGDKGNQHDAVRLSDGRVLLIGWSPDYADSFIFSPDTNTFTQTSGLIPPRMQAATTLLDDGRVMVVGGVTVENADITHAVAFFDPATETWEAGPSTQGEYSTAVARRLADGRVLLVSTGAAGFIGLPPELFDPRSNRWTTLDSLPLTTTWSDIAVLADGRVVLSGFHASSGDTALLTLDMTDGSYEQSVLTDIYSYAFSKMQPLADGRLLVVSYLSYGKVGIFDPIRQQWSFLGNTNSLPPIALFPNGEILWAGSNDSPPRTGILDVQTERFTLIDGADWPFFPDMHRLTPLLDGRMLLTGPTGPGSGAYLYGKSNGQPCTGSTDCIHGHCVDGYCCNEACDDGDSCNACATYRGAKANGTCAKVLACAPYQCGQVDIKPDGQDATCTTACAHAADCAPGYACNLEGQCVEPKNVDINQGCATVPGNTPADRHAALLTLLGLVALGKRRRFTSQRRPYTYCRPPVTNG